ncbi:MAG: NUDIX hydrolase [Deltaproteobacteria bacterium]|nr:NUDIX hydrolase [Deltaproteobacteria bacterium]
MTEIRDAATVIVLRGSPLQVLLVRRHARSGFMAGAYVFPGGKVDPADREQVQHRPELLERAKALRPTPGRTLLIEDAAAHYQTAVRETAEESGLLIDPLQLHYFAHWITPSFEPRRFDTRFFVAMAPEGQEARVDEREITDLRWETPEAALSAHEGGEIFLPPPTQLSLQELVGLADLDAVLALLERRPITPILPKVSTQDGAFTILLPWDPDYAATEGEALFGTSVLPGPSRITIRPKG